MSLLARLEAELQAEPGLRLAIVFGSAARGQAGWESDLDIALALAEPMTWEVKMAWIERLALIASRPVDLVDLHDLTGELLREILTRGRPLVLNDRGFYADLIKRMWYDQADFAPLRRRLLEERRRRWLEPAPNR